MPSQIEAKWDGVIHPQNYNFSQLKNTWRMLMLSKHYKSTAVYRRTWPHIHSRTYGTSALTLNKYIVVEIQRETSSEMFSNTILKPELINNVDHYFMCISGNKHSLVFFS